MNWQWPSGDQDWQYGEDENIYPIEENLDEDRVIYSINRTDVQTAEGGLQQSNVGSPDLAPQDQTEDTGYWHWYVPQDQTDDTGYWRCSTSRLWDIPNQATTGKYKCCQSQCRGTSFLSAHLMHVRS